MQLLSVHAMPRTQDVFYCSGYRSIDTGARNGIAVHELWLITEQEDAWIQWEENSSDLVMFMHKGAALFRHFSTNVVSNIVYRGHYMSTQKTKT